LFAAGLLAYLIYGCSHNVRKCRCPSTDKSELMCL